MSKRQKASADIANPSRRRLLAAGLATMLAQPGARATARQAPAFLRVMSFNMWHGGDAGGQPLAQSAAVIRAAGADIVGLQETGGREVQGARPDHGARMAAMLGWHYVDQGERTGILSRWPITGGTARDAAAAIRTASGHTVHMCNVHLAHAPYQPYQLLGIPYEDAPFLKTADEAVAAARAARGAQIAAVLATVRPLLAAGHIVVLTGDFNEPSHLDWTPRAVEAGLAPLAVSWPTTEAVTDTGLRDAYRVAFPDEVAHPGHTWTPTTAPTDRSDRHDRIDFVFAGGGRVGIENCRVVGEDPAVAGSVVRPWPSDHRAVVATLRLR